MSRPLPPYSREGPCPKCGVGDNVTTLLNERVLSTTFLAGNPYRDTSDCPDQEVRKHLHRFCRNCKFEWCEALAVLEKAWPAAPEEAKP